MSYLQDSPSSFFVLRVAQVKKANDFFFRRATYKGTYVEAAESARAGLSPKKGGREKKEKKTTKEGGLLPQEGDVTRFKKRKRPRKARRWLREGKVPCVLNQELLFLVHEYSGLEAARLV